MKMMHITIQTQNFNEEIKFYQEIIGLSIQHEMNGMGRHIVFLGDNLIFAEKADKMRKIRLKN